MVNSRPHLSRYAPIAVHDLHDTKCVMWATLALDALCRHSVEIDGDDLPSSPFGHAVVAIRQAYTKPSLEAEYTGVEQFPWLTYDLALRNSMVQDLIRACEALYPCSASGVVTGSPTYYCRIFYDCCHGNNEFLPAHLLLGNPEDSGITRLMRELNEHPINHMLNRVKFFLNWQHTEASFPRTAVRRAIATCVDEVGFNIQEYIQDKLEIPDLSGDVSSNTISYHFVRDAMPIVRLTIAEHVEQFFTNLGFTLDAVPASGSTCIGNYGRFCLANQDRVRREVDGLYEDLADLFTHLSPLLEAYGPIEKDDVAEHVAAHSFELYADDDWFTRELHLQDDLEDVLHGPEHTTKDEVSDPLAASDASPPPCGICGETDTTMRKLKECRHVMCDDCLTTQLDSKHACRYKCPFCRANFFSLH